MFTFFSRPTFTEDFEVPTTADRDLNLPAGSVTWTNQPPPDRCRRGPENILRTGTYPTVFRTRIIFVLQVNSKQALHEKFALIKEKFKFVFPLLLQARNCRMKLQGQERPQISSTCSSRRR
jgi:hypothetical protein